MPHVPIGLFACLLQWTGDAIFGNAEFDLLLALGIATGVTFEEIKLSVFALRFGARAAQAGMVAILALRLIASDRQEPALVLFDPGFRSQLKADERSARAEAVRVSQVQGDVFCTNKVICRLASGQAAGPSSALRTTFLCRYILVLPADYSYCLTVDFVALHYGFRVYYFDFLGERCG
jgi:hypothetical protein